MIESAELERTPSAFAGRGSRLRTSPLQTEGKAGMRGLLGGCAERRRCAGAQGACRTGTASREKSPQGSAGACGGRLGVCWSPAQAGAPIPTTAQHRMCPICRPVPASASGPLLRLRPVRALARGRLLPAPHWSQPSTGDAGGCRQHPVLLGLGGMASPQMLLVDSSRYLRRSAFLPVSGRARLGAAQDGAQRRRRRRLPRPAGTEAMGSGAPSLRGPDRVSPSSGEMRGYDLAPRPSRRESLLARTVSVRRRRARPA